ncbi:MAG: ComF family protein [Rhodocyclaceae bacterium]|nr:MAG: ComF family protein [Rhodocyclaceae bacterium]
MSILAEKLTQAGRQLIESLLPQDCLLCSAPSADDLLCTACRADLPLLPSPACPRCALPTAGGEVCGRCLRHPPHFDRLIAAFPYAFPIDRMLQQFKYGHQLALAGWFGKQLAMISTEEDGGLAADLIVPMPLHPRRMKERGFNQALEIARQLQVPGGARLATTLCERIRETAPQEGLSLLQRRRNLRNAFICREDLHGKRILLVDDVVTTGASINECARTLRLHGAAAVTVLAVARTLLD